MTAFNQDLLDNLNCGCPIVEASALTHLYNLNYNLQSLEEKAVEIINIITSGNYAENYPISFLFGFLTAFKEIENNELIAKIKELVLENYENSPYLTRIKANKRPEIVEFFLAHLDPENLNTSYTALASLSYLPLEDNSNTIEKLKTFLNSVSDETIQRTIRLTINELA